MRNHAYVEGRALLGTHIRRLATVNRCRHVLLVALVVEAALAAGAAHAGRSTASGPNGLIVYAVELKPDHYQLFTIRPDGSDPAQITHGTGTSLNADWSPDGRSLAYELGQPTTSGIAVAAASGTGRKILTPPGGFQGQPSFSPDGNGLRSSATPPLATTGSG